MSFPAGNPFQPGGLALLAAWSARERGAGRRGTFRPSASRSGALRDLRPILDLAEARALAAESRGLLEAKLPMASPTVLDDVARVLEELGANIVQHSGRPDTGFGVALADPAGRGLQFACADGGVGFKASLARNPEFEGRLADDAAAIQLAVQSGVSGVGGRTNAGRGLPMLVDLSDRLRADLWILTGEALWHRFTSGRERRTTVAIVPPYAGAWICLDAPRLPA